MQRWQWECLACGPFCQTFNKSSNSGWGQQSENRGRKKRGTVSDQALCLQHEGSLYLCIRNSILFPLYPFADIYGIDFHELWKVIHFRVYCSFTGPINCLGSLGIFIHCFRLPSLGRRLRGRPLTNLCVAPAPGCVPIIMVPAMRISAVLLSIPPYTPVLS